MKIDYGRVVEMCLLSWFLVGLWFAVVQANGKQLADIRPAWRRRCAMILTCHAFVFIWLLVRAIEFLSFVGSDIPNTIQTIRDSWNGRAKNIESPTAPQQEREGS